jgi:hypothetical protein
MNNRRIWPRLAWTKITVQATDKQLLRWTDAARIQEGYTDRPHVGTFLARAGDDYARKVYRAYKRKMARLKKEGKL